MRKIIVLLVLPFVLLSCVTASGPVFKEVTAGDNDSVIYFYREFSMYGAPMAVDIYANEKHVVSLDNDGYFPYRVKPGLVKIKAVGGFLEGKLSMNVEPKRKYYVRTGGQGSYNGATIKSGLILEYMEHKRGVAEIVDNRLQEEEL